MALDLVQWLTGIHFIDAWNVILQCVAWSVISVLATEVGKTVQTKQKLSPAPQERTAVVRFMERKDQWSITWKAVYLQRNANPLNWIPSVTFGTVKWFAVKVIYVMVTTHNTIGQRSDGHPQCIRDFLASSRFKLSLIVRPDHSH